MQLENTATSTEQMSHDGSGIRPSEHSLGALCCPMAKPLKSCVKAFIALVQRTGTKGRQKTGEVEIDPEELYQQLLDEQA